MAEWMDGQLLAFVVAITLLSVTPASIRCW